MVPSLPGAIAEGGRYVLGDEEMDFGGNAGGWEKDEGVSAFHLAVPGAKCQGNMKCGDERTR